MYLEHVVIIELSILKECNIFVYMHVYVIWVLCKAVVHIFTTDML